MILKIGYLALKFDIKLIKYCSLFKLTLIPITKGIITNKSTTLRLVNTNLEDLKCFFVGDLKKKYMKHY